jgi:hypothetical protein
MKKLFSILVMMLSSAVVMAATDDISLLEALTSGQDKAAAAQPDPNDPCVKLNLTDAQKATLKDMMYQSSEKRIQERADIQKAKVTAFHTLSSPTSVKADGQSAQDAVLAAVSVMQKDMSDMTVNIIYDVLQPDQRENAILCHMAPKGSHGGANPSHP